MRHVVLLAAGAALSLCVLSAPTDARTRPREVGTGGAFSFDDSGRWIPVVAAGPAFEGAAGRGIDQRLRDLVSSAAMAAGVPVRLAHAVVRAESGYRPRAVSWAKALGIGQIKCQTARSLGFEGPCAGLFDPESNLRYSMQYLRLALNRGGQGCAGLSLYERGIAARPRCTSYGRRVMVLASR
jgi:hypothetical protein